MNESQTPTNGGAPTMETSSNGRNPAQKFDAEQEMVFQLKTAIDQRGRYSYRLNDMAAGYAAGRKISVMKARTVIEESFERHVGERPQQYLDRHYSELKQGRKPEGRSR